MFAAGQSYDLQSYQDNAGTRKQNSLRPVRDRHLLNQHLDSAQALSESQPMRAIDQINSAIELSISNGDRNSEGFAYLILGNIQQKLAQHELAIENYKKCIQTLSDLPMKQKFQSKAGPNENKTHVFSGLKQLAVSLMALARYDEAAGKLLQCLERNYGEIPAAERMEAKRLLAQVRLRQGRSSESMDLLTEVLATEKEGGHTEGEIRTYWEIGELQRVLKNDKKAIENFTTAKQLSEKTKSAYLKSRSSELLASMFRQQKKVEEEVALRNSDLVNNTASDAVQNYRNNIEIGNAYVTANQQEKAIPYYENSVAEFISTSVKSPIMTKESAKEGETNVLKFLTEAYMKKGDVGKALEYLNKYAALQDSLQQLRKKELDDALRLGTQLGKNQQRIDLLEKERQLSERSIEILRADKQLKENELGVRNIIIGSLGLGIVFLLFMGIVMLRNAREKKRVHQLLAIKSLRGQMNPHFIFNALNSVNHYISRNDERAANKYLADFSRLMRSVMDSSKHDFIPLNEETETLRLYLELEHARFSDKFDYSFTIADTVNISDFELPPMLIQPYIENAVWHGLRYIEGKGRLDVNFTQVQDELKVTICDNGIGRKRSAEIKTRNQRSQASVGMQNIENRITIMNELYKFNIRVSVTDAFPDAENSGTLVEILIPKKSDA